MLFNATSTLDDETAIKIALLLEGASLTSSAAMLITNKGKAPIAARTGVANGLEAILPAGTWVNIPINPASSVASRFSIEHRPDQGGLYLTSEGLSIEIEIPLRPRWYGTKTSRGVDLLSVGTLRGDRIGVALYKSCIYFASHRQCKFCAIKVNNNAEQVMKNPADVVEAVRIAMDDPVAAARHAYFDLGNTRHPERGLKTYEPIMAGINEYPGFQRARVHLNQTVPRTPAYLHVLKEMGFAELSFNLEVFDEDAARVITPGKWEDIGVSGHLAMLAAAVDCFGLGNVSSTLIVGLEKPHSTIAGVEALMRLGVIPKLSVFRPLRGSDLEGSKPVDVNLLTEVLIACQELARRYRIPLGPICEPCRMLSLVLH